MQKQASSIQKRILFIKKLAKEYFALAHGAPIFNYQELLRVFDIRGSKNQYHPHKGLRVYISRMALKHCIESRKYELSKNHKDEDIFDAISFAIDNMQETIVNFSSYEYVPPSNHFYTKDYSNEGKPLLRILLELKKKALQIKSIHFRKNKKKEN